MNILDNIRDYYISIQSIRLRTNYLRKIKEYRDAGFQLIYIDESWIDSTDYTGEQWFDMKVTPAEITSPGSPMVANLNQPKC